MYIRTVINNLIARCNLQVVRYLLIGGWNTLFGMAVYAGLYYWFGSRVHYLVLLVPSNILAITNAYACYKLFGFKTQGNILREYYRCYVVYGGMMLAGAVFMLVLVEWICIPPPAANCICVLTTTLVSYFTHRNFTFKQVTAPGATPVTETKTAFLVFCLLSTIALILHLVSMRSIPLPWMDGVHINELGRLFLTDNPLEKSLMVNSDGTSAMVFYYVGPVLQEILYQLFGFAGPRFSPMLGLLIAACLCRAWLLKKRNSPWLATMLALMVLTSPVLTQSIRFVRIDTWNVALFFAIVYLMECATGQLKHKMRRYFFIAGALTSLSLFVWPTSFVFIFYYIANLWSLRATNCIPLSETLKLLLSAAAGACITSMALIIPLFSQIDMIINNLHLHYYYFIMGKEVSLAHSLLIKTKDTVICILKETLRDPLFMMAVAIGCLSSVKRLRNYAMWIACGFVALGVCAGTHLYIYRYIYLLPFILMLAKTGIQAIQRNHPKTGSVFAISLLGYGFLTSFVAPLTMACIYKGRSMHDITERLRNAIGDGEKRVYVCSYQTYYPARTLGWRFYSYMPGHSIYDDSLCASLLPRVDYVIDAIPSPFPGVVEEGYTLYSVVRDYSIHSAIALSEKSDGLNRYAPSWGYRMKAIIARIAYPLYNANCEADRVRSERFFVAQGFAKERVLDLTPQDSVYTPLERWILSKQTVKPNYDSLVIWRRSAKPDDCPPHDRQTR